MDRHLQIRMMPNSGLIRFILCGILLGKSLGVGFRAKTRPEQSFDFSTKDEEGSSEEGAEGLERKQTRPWIHVGVGRALKQAEYPHHKARRDSYAAESENNR